MGSRERERGGDLHGDGNGGGTGKLLCCLSSERVEEREYFPGKTGEKTRLSVRRAISHAVMWVTKP